jgi:predicted Kef-type K+ transport protein/voltage-gated potassium channel Kch
MVMSVFESFSIDNIFPYALALAFLLGFAARSTGLPPMVGFLIAGFLLNALGVQGSETIDKVGDFGVTLLLFTIGLKLKVRDLLRAEVWAGASVHAGISVVVFGLVFYGLAIVGLSLFAGLDLPAAVLLGFAGSFSSTVFAVKILEEKGESGSLHGRTAIGILIMQDIFAVLFLTFSTGKIPAPWAPVLLGLYFARPILGYLLNRVGHGELVPLFGLFAAVGLGAELFDLANLKPDLGALLLGMLMAAHPRASEVANALFGLKELLLIGFFLSIGLAGTPTLEHVMIAILLMLLIPFKTVLFFWLLTRFRLRARSSLLAALSLSNYSEFGLIVAAISVANGWLSPDWLLIMALAVSISFVLAAPLNAASHRIYSRWSPNLAKFETRERHPEDQPIDVAGMQTVIFGMGRIGTGAYDFARKYHGNEVVGIDSDMAVVEAHLSAGRNVLHGDATDADFWRRVVTQPEDAPRYALLTMSEHSANRHAVEQMRSIGFRGFIAALAKHADEAADLETAGADLAIDIYAEAGAGFAAEISRRLESAPGS